MILEISLPGHVGGLLLGLFGIMGPFLPLVKMLKLGRRCSEGQGMLPFKATKRESSSTALPFYSFLEYMLQVWTEDFI